MHRLLLALIRLYQRHLSPRKGFSCAYRVHTGRASCSALGYRAVRRHGAFKGLALTRERTRRCGAEHRHHGPLPRRLHAQQGVCDAGCDLPCDSPCDAGPGGGRGLAHLCDLADCCGCDWPSRDKGTRRPVKDRRATGTLRG